MAEVTTILRDQANRKCPYCSAETLTPTQPRKPPSEARRAPAGGGARGAGVCHPHIQNPNLSTPTARSPKFTSGGDPRLPGHYLPRSSQSACGPEDSTPRTSRSTTNLGRGAAKTPKGLGALPQTAASPSRALSVLRATSEPSRRDGTPRRGFCRETPAPGVSLTLRKNSELFTGPHSPQFDTLAEPTHDPSHALGRPPRRHQFLTVQKCPGASRDSCLRAPRPWPVARAASAPGSVAAGRGGERGRR